MSTIGLKRISAVAVTPTKGTAGSAGFDLASAEKVELYPGEQRTVSTGWKITVPYGHEVQVRSRSGLAAKEGIAVLNSPGTIDSDYTGELKVILVNHGKQKRVFEPGDRIAQMVLCKLPDARIDDSGNTYDERADFVSDSRGDAGFGSTGV